MTGHFAVAAGEQVLLASDTTPAPEVKHGACPLGRGARQPVNIASSDPQSPTPFSSCVRKHSAIALCLTLPRRILRALGSGWHQLGVLRGLAIASEVSLCELKMAILEKSYNPVADPAEKTSDCAGAVVMIDMKGWNVVMWLRSLSTHRAYTALICKHCIIFNQADTVPLSERIIFLPLRGLRQPFLVSDWIARLTGLRPALVC